VKKLYRIYATMEVVARSEREAEEIAIDNPNDFDVKIDEVKELELCNRNDCEWWEGPDRGCGFDYERDVSDFEECPFYRQRD